MLISSILGVVAGSTIVGVEMRCGRAWANSAVILDKTSESTAGGASGASCLIALVVELYSVGIEQRG
jgi:hypothetical protein